MVNGKRRIVYASCGGSLCSIWCPYRVKRDCLVLYIRQCDLRVTNTYTHTETNLEMATKDANRAMCPRQWCILHHTLHNSRVSNRATTHTHQPRHICINNAEAPHTSSAFAKKTKKMPRARSRVGKRVYHTRSRARARKSCDMRARKSRSSHNRGIMWSKLNGIYWGGVGGVWRRTQDIYYLCYAFVGSRGRWKMNHPGF